MVDMSGLWSIIQMSTISNCKIIPVAIPFTNWHNGPMGNRYTHKLRKREKKRITLKMYYK